MSSNKDYCPANSRNPNHEVHVLADYFHRNLVDKEDKKEEL